MPLDADTYIRKHYRQGMTAPQIAAELTREGGQTWTDARVRVRAQRLGVAEYSGRSGKPEVRALSLADQERLRNLWPDHTATEVAAILQRSRRFVSTWARKLGLPAKAEPSMNIVPRKFEVRASPAPERSPALNVLRGNRRSARDMFENAASRWGVERHIEEQRMASDLRCACGAPGALRCAKHRAMLEAGGWL